jgi:diaminopimelate decarboxylase
MKSFYYKNNELFCEDLAVSEIAQEIGTPFYLYSRTQLEQNFYTISKAMKQIDHLICYALKANANLALLQILAEKGCGAEVVSGGELLLAIKSGIRPDRIVFSGVGKTDEEIEAAITNRILLINVESVEELKIIDQIARKIGRKAHIAIRINPDVDARTHPHITTGLRGSKFGIDLQHSEEAFKLASSLSGINVKGIHCHIGSMINEIEPFVKATRAMVQLISQIKSLNISLSHIDIGGGVGIDYTRMIDMDTRKTTQNPIAVNAEILFTSTIPIIKEYNLKMIFEPGRLLVANTGILMTRVLFKKNSGARNFTIIDAGMNDLIRPALYNAYHQIVTVRYASGLKEKTSIAGPICETGDLFAHDQLLPTLKRNDLLAITGAGAYGYVLSSNYNGRLRPPEILVDGNNYRIIRKRENRDVLWKGTQIKKE